MTATAEKTVVTTANDATSALVSKQGTTTIADTVVQKIAGLAAREVNGVHELGGGGAARALSALRDRIPGASSSVGQGFRSRSARSRPPSICSSSSSTASPSRISRGRCGAT